MEKSQASEAELESLRRTSAAEKQQSQSFVEKLEMELAERKLACHHLQEEAQKLSQELAQARAAEDTREQESRASQKRHREEMEEKQQQIVQLQRAEQDLRSSYDTLLAENSRLQQDVLRPLESSAPQGQESGLLRGCRCFFGSWGDLTTHVLFGPGGRSAADAEATRGFDQQHDGICICALGSVG